MREALEALDQVSINFSGGDSLILNIILALIMFGIALEISIKDFKNVFYKPKALIVGLASQFLVLPAVTFLIVAIGYQVIPPSVAMGMILLAACPGGNMANFMSSLAKGNAALSVSITSVNSVIAFLTTPFNYAIWGALYKNFINKRSESLLQTLELSVPDMLLTLVIILVIPLILGMTFRHYFPKAAEKLVKPMKSISLLLFVGILVVALAGNFKIFMSHIGWIFVIVLIHYMAIVGAGYLLAALFRLNQRDKRAVTIETGTQNSGLGLALMLNPKIFPAGVVPGGMLFVVAWWGIWHIIGGFILVAIFRRRPIKDDHQQVDAAQIEGVETE